MRLGFKVLGVSIMWPLFFTSNNAIMRGFFQDNPVSSINKTELQDIIEMVLKVVLNIIIIPVIIHLYYLLNITRVRTTNRLMFIP